MEYSIKIDINARNMQEALGLIAEKLEEIAPGETYDITSIECIDVDEGFVFATKIKVGQKQEPETNIYEVPKQLSHIPGLGDLYLAHVRGELDG